MTTKSRVSRLQFWLTVAAFALPSQLSHSQAVPPVLEIEIDILPGSLAPFVNSTVAGEIPVAILGSAELDVANVDISTLEFGPGPARPVHEPGGHIEDVNDDGYSDLVSHYHTDDAEIVDLGLGSTRTCLRGSLVSGVPIEGCGELSITPTSFLESGNVAVGEFDVVVVGDFDGDGDPDVVASVNTREYISKPVGTCRDYQPAYRLDHVIWYENLNGRGLFSPARPLLFNLNEITTLSLGDVDGDEDLDLVVGTAREGALTLYPNADGLGTLAPAQTIATGIDPPRGVELADLDGDDDVDIAWTGQIYRECLHNNGSVGWFENTNGLGDFSAEIELYFVGAPRLEVADVDADGDYEIVSANVFDRPTLYNIIDRDHFVATDLRSDLNCNWPYVVNTDDDLDLDFVCEDRRAENVGTFNGEIAVEQWRETGVPPRNPYTSTFDVDLDGDTDYVVGYVGPHHVPPRYEPQPGASIHVYERRDNPEWEDYLTSGAAENYAYFLSPTYLHPDDNGDPYSDFDYRDAVTKTIPVDMDMDTDIDLIIVAPGMNQIYWFENSLLSPEPTLPVASAGDDQVVIVGGLAPLDGSASYDPEAEPLSFAWEVVTAPEAAVAELAGASTEMPEFSTDIPGNYVVQLVVSDASASSQPDTANVTVVTAQERFEQQIVQAIEIVNSLADEDFASAYKRWSLVEDLNELIGFIRANRVSKATRDLKRFVTKTDGCADTGHPDEFGIYWDFVTNCEAQAPLYELLTQALGTLAHPSLTAPVK